MATSTKIQRWGNSLGVRLPKETTRKLKLEHNTPVTVSEKRGAIIVLPVQKKKISLGVLLVKMKKNTLHTEHNFGKRVGNELW